MSRDTKGGIIDGHSSCSMPKKCRVEKHVVVVVVVGVVDQHAASTQTRRDGLSSPQRKKGRKEGRQDMKSQVCRRMMQEPLHARVHKCQSGYSLVQSRRRPVSSSSKRWSYDSSRKCCRSLSRHCCCRCCCRCAAVSCWFAGGACCRAVRVVGHNRQREETHAVDVHDGLRRPRRNTAPITK